MFLLKSLSFIGILFYYVYKAKEALKIRDNLANKKRVASSSNIHNNNFNNNISMP